METQEVVLHTVKSSERRINRCRFGSECQIFTHPSFQPPVQSDFSHSWDSLSNQLPFSCDESRKQPLQVALKAPEEDTEEIGEMTVSLATAKEISMNAARADVYQNWMAFLN